MRSEKPNINLEFGKAWKAAVLNSRLAESPELEPKGKFLLLFQDPREIGAI